MQQGSIDKKNNKQKGNKGEELAVEYLIKKAIIYIDAIIFLVKTK